MVKHHPNVFACIHSIQHMTDSYSIQPLVYNHFIHHQTILTVFLYTTELFQSYWAFTSWTTLEPFYINNYAFLHCSFCKIKWLTWYCHILYILYRLLHHWTNNQINWDKNIPRHGLKGEHRFFHRRQGWPQPSSTTPHTTSKQAPLLPNTQGWPMSPTQGWLTTPPNTTHHWHHKAGHSHLPKIWMTMPFHPQKEYCTTKSKH